GLEPCLVGGFEPARCRLVRRQGDVEREGMTLDDERAESARGPRQPVELRRLWHVSVDRIKGDAPRSVRRGPLAVARPSRDGRSRRPAAPRRETMCPTYR